MNITIPTIPTHSRGVVPLISGFLLLIFSVTGCAKPITIRFATFNASLNRDQPGMLVEHLRRGDDAQIEAVAEIIQRVRPDVILINEFDYDPAGEAARLFQANYLARGQNGAEPITFAYSYCEAVNTGVASGIDLDGDGVATTQPGTRGYGSDSLGFGLFPGQYGMLILSKYPILADQIVSLRGVLWSEMPGAMLPQKQDGSAWYSADALRVLRLSSKTHVDVPIATSEQGGKIVHLLASHPTPPAFDGPEDRNGRRNHDEIRLWADYITGGEAAGYLFGPARAVGPEPARNSFETTLQGGFARGRIAFTKPPQRFVIVGDLNADPKDGASVPGAIQQLLNHPRVNSANPPSSEGASEAARLQAGNNASHRSDPRFDTADFGDTGNAPGNLRVDYVLPSVGLKLKGAGVFWPGAGDPLHRLVEKNASSDHRLVWIDVELD
ncbi:MAG TPA: endonuclease/exonuclease/phosphatase family protein [Tepidisphaeraceae bacterium]|nr:endonuclease/exonuclease/phosphatase family protein [Tepidisphaeraceae bacterium]